jgi:cell division septum initiation protein DivIVA
MTETTHDVDGLLRKNAELLGEVKELKAKLAEVEGERDTANADAAAAKEAARQVSLEKPLESDLGGAFVAPWRVVRPLLDEHFDFAVGDDGSPSITDKKGRAVAPGTMIAELAAIPDLAAMLRPAQGGGAKGSGHHDRAMKPTKPETVAPAFGLR